MTTIGKLNLCTPSHFVYVELSLDYVVRMNRVDLNDTDMSYDSVKTTRVDSHCHDKIRQLLNDS